MVNPDTFDFIVVGSGAGGGPLAANLARAGHTVALLEAGVDPADMLGSQSYWNYSVPAFHGQATQDPQIGSDFHVQHYGNPKRQHEDSKYVKNKGILYPRATALGGCTANNAMIALYPHNEDWNSIAQLMDDPSWSAEKMRDYFQKVEDCRYAPPSPNTGRHGFGGWLATSLADPSDLTQPDRDHFTDMIRAAVAALLDDVIERLAPQPTPENLVRVLDFLERHMELGRSLAGSVGQTLNTLLANAEDEFIGLRQDLADARKVSQQQPSAREIVGRLARRVVEATLLLLPQNQPLIDFLTACQPYLDPNDWRVAEHNLPGVYATPLATNGVCRTGPREYVLHTAREYPNWLTVKTGALAARVVFTNGAASGVEYFEKKDLAGTLPSPMILHARKEIILSAGAFKTPQLLMQSGVGPKDQLAQCKIGLVHELPGVGQNLQDHYEIAVISSLKHRFQLLEDDFRSPNGSAFQNWIKDGKGLCTGNGAVLSIIKHSKQARTEAPDLFLFGIPGYFRGYHPDYANELSKWPHLFTWVIRKGHTRNTAGTVRLTSADPRATPAINFRYFEEGNNGWNKDLAALVEGIEFVRGLMRRTGTVDRTFWPPDAVKKHDEIAEFVMREAWGNQACGTCKMGRNDDPNAVVDGNFRVRGVKKLRVVDASVFPRIPGFFLATAISMIAEKASDVILRDAR